jgi:hypothetical protein
MTLPASAIRRRRRGGRLLSKSPVVQAVGKSVSVLSLPLRGNLGRSKEATRRPSLHPGRLTPCLGNRANEHGIHLSLHRRCRAWRGRSLERLGKEQLPCQRQANNAACIACVATRSRKSLFRIRFQEEFGPPRLSSRGKGAPLRNREKRFAHYEPRPGATGG